MGTQNLNMGHILVPTDFSPNASQALDFALQLAQYNQDEVTVFHAFRSKTDLLEVDFEVESPRAHMDELLKSHRGGKVFGLIKEGDVLDAIAELTASGLYSMVVMGAKGAGSISERLFGSITTQVLEKIELPLLVVPEKSHFKPIKKVALALSFSTEDMQAIEVVKNFAFQWDACLVCFHVAFDAGDQVEAEAKMTQIQENFWETPIDKLSFEVVVNEDIQDGINEFVKNYSVDVLAVVPLKHGFWSSFFQSSVSQKLALRSQIPLLIVKV